LNLLNAKTLTDEDQASRNYWRRHFPKAPISNELLVTRNDSAVTLSMRSQPFMGSSSTHQPDVKQDRAASATPGRPFVNR